MAVKNLPAQSLNGDENTFKILIDTETGKAELIDCENDVGDDEVISNEEMSDLLKNHRDVIPSILQAVMDRLGPKE